MLKKIILIGGSGNLGSEIIKINSKILYPSKKDLDIRFLDSIEKYFSKQSADLVINCAAVTDTVMCEKNIESCIKVNILGPLNLALIQKKYNFKLVQISTDYVFDGKLGGYKPDDPINPISNYSKSKAAAELILRMNPENLIIRTSFFPLDFKHASAFTDQYTTKDFVDVIAPIVYKESVSEKSGILHIGTKRDSVYNKVAKRYPNIGKMSRKEINSVYIPFDTSLKQ